MKKNKHTKNGHTSLIGTYFDVAKQPTVDFKEYKDLIFLDKTAPFVKLPKRFRIGRRTRSIEKLLKRLFNP